MLGIRDGYGAVYHGDKDKLVVWVGDGQVFTETKAIEYRRPPGAWRCIRARISIITRIGWFRSAPVANRS
jgi:hypothetical protein